MVTTADLLTAAAQSVALAELTLIGGRLQCANAAITSDTLRFRRALTAVAAQITPGGADGATEDDATVESLWHIASYCRRVTQLGRAERQTSLATVRDELSATRDKAHAAVDRVALVAVDVPQRDAGADFDSQQRVLPQSRGFDELVVSTDIHLAAGFLHPHYFVPPSKPIALLDGKVRPVGIQPRSTVKPPRFTKSRWKRIALGAALAIAIAAAAAAVVVTRNSSSAPSSTTDTTSTPTPTVAPTATPEANPSSTPSSTTETPSTPTPTPAPTGTPLAATPPTTTTPTPTAATPPTTAPSVSTVYSGFGVFSLRAITVSQDGYIYVSDGTGIFRLQEGEKPTSASYYAGSSSYAYQNGYRTDARFKNIRGLVTDSDGDLFIADASSFRVRWLDMKTGAVADAAGSGGYGSASNGPSASATFKEPFGLSVDSSNNVYITDAMDDTVRKLSRTQDLVTTVVSGLSGANGVFAVSILPMGELYVGGPYAVHKVSSDGSTTSLVAGDTRKAGYADGTGSTVLFDYIIGMALSPTGDAIYIADVNNHCIRKMSLPAAEVSTFAGQCTVNGTADGNAANALFYMPLGLAFGPSGALYVVDGPFGGTRLRRIDIAV